MRAALVVVLLALAACKGDAQKCEQASRNYATLMYWKKANARIDALPEAERQLAREKELSKFTNALEADVDFFVRQCQSANNDEQVDCMIAAKTAEAVAKCADLAKE
ncbi:MAG: hypothetical protein H0T89_17480 [Deltaproteobacteria bacterium]|nr:hypothetical protein [Deltaproteobacteria bacterium]MDQ3297873.1 hypothetical protein [Myxococcota bacterium]